MNIDNNQDENLNDIIEYCKQHDEYFQIIQQFKLKNIIYKVGDNICLWQKETGGKKSIGKILQIVKITRVQFPVLLVAWYFSRDDPCVSEQNFNHLGKQELILSKYQDWQYMETVKGKIQIVDEKTYACTDKEKCQEIYFCRSYINMDENIEQILSQIPKPICFCTEPFNPDFAREVCGICKRFFHLGCNKNKKNHSLCIWPRDRKN